ncbi:MAG: hypothetical protein ACLPUT_05280 [Solirubrobacteraceae bacterium]
MVERGGRIRFRVIASRHGAVLSNAVIANVDPASLIITDDWASYKPTPGRLEGPVLARRRAKQLGEVPEREQDRERP